MKPAGELCVYWAFGWTGAGPKSGYGGGGPVG